MDFTNRPAAGGEELPGCLAASQGPQSDPGEQSSETGAGAPPHTGRPAAPLSGGFLWLCDSDGNVKAIAPMENGASKNAARTQAPAQPGAHPKLAARTGGHWLELVEEDGRAVARAAWEESRTAPASFERVLRMRAFEGPPARYFARMLPYAAIATTGQAAPCEAGWIGVAVEVDNAETGNPSESHSGTRTALLELAAKATNDVLWDWNLLTQELWWGENFYSKFGYSREETGPDIRSWKTRIHPEDLDRVAGGIEACIRAGGEHWEDHYRFRTRSGEYAVIHDRGYIQRGKSGAPERMVGAMIDVTKENRAREEILRLNREMEQQVSRRNIEIAAATTALEAFSYSVSHDLRAPIRHIVGFVELLKRSDGERLSDEGRRYLALIVESGERMGGLIDALLSLSRLGRREMNVSRINLCELVEGIRKDFGAELSGRRIDWIIHPLPSSWGDRVLIRQIFVNLIDNAVKYTRVRELARIEIGAADKGNEWEFFVKDNGVGFDMKYAEKLFHVFQRLHSERDFEGYGVGLANVHRIVAIHGGRVWADSAVDQGTTLFFTLPKSPQLIAGEAACRNELTA